jgi:hypothetical protein
MKKQPAKAAKDAGMEVDSVKPKKQQAKFGDFGDMSSMLTTMESKIEKSLKHETRVK